MGCSATKEIESPLNQFLVPLPGMHVSSEFKFYDQLRETTTVSLKTEGQGLKTDLNVAAWCATHLLGHKRDEERYTLLAQEISKQLGHGVEANSHQFETVPRKVTTDTLAYLFRGNPFLASAIQVETMAGVGPRLCLKSHTLPADVAMPNFFNKLTACVEARWDRFRVVLTDSLEVESWTFFRCSTAGEWAEVELDLANQINVVTSTLMFYFQCVHANLHIFHFMMVSGLYTVTRGNGKLEAFASPYVPNIVLKYEEVQSLLISETGALVKGFCPQSRPQLLEVLAEMISMWGSCSGSQEFVEKFLFVPASDEQAKALAKPDVWVPQFRAQSDLVPVFAADVAEHMRSDADYALADLNAALGQYFNGCGRGFPVTSLRQWLELMSVTGLLHGCTLSLTRLTFTEANLWQMAPDSDEFTPYIIEQLGTAFGTLVGLDDDRQVFTTEGLEDTQLGSIVQRHLQLSEDLKVAYKNSLDVAGPKFKAWGWILTDYFPDMFDAKQLTITTYV
jgi:hypothetical protein